VYPKVVVLSIGINDVIFASDEDLDVSSLYLLGSHHIILCVANYGAREMIPNLGTSFHNLFGKAA
jgi:hypothetical protein